MGFARNRGVPRDHALQGFCSIELRHASRCSTCGDLGMESSDVTEATHYRNARSENAFTQLVANWRMRVLNRPSCSIQLKTPAALCDISIGETLIEFRPVRQLAAVLKSALRNQP